MYLSSVRDWNVSGKGDVYFCINLRFIDFRSVWEMRFFKWNRLYTVPAYTVRTWRRLVIYLMSLYLTR